MNLAQNLRERISEKATRKKKKEKAAKCKNISKFIKSGKQNESQKMELT